MKKFIWFVPPAVFILLSLLSLFSGTVTASPYWLIWPLVLILAGILLSKGYIRGAVLGLLPSIDRLYMGLNSKDAISLNLILGIVFTAFYGISAVILYTRRKNNS